MREPAPPYRGEPPYALWHVSEDAAIRRFEPRADPRHDSAEPLVWAVDSRHLPLYWFSRECPRATFWARSGTSSADVERFLDGERGRRVHVVEPEWLERLRAARVVAYRLPPESFVPYERAGGYWVGAEPVEPLEVVELGDLVARHDAAGIELRAEERLLALWEQVVASTLEYSGIRLRNALPATRS